MKNAVVLVQGWQNWIRFIPIPLACILYLGHFAVILYYAVDVPLRDDWAFLLPNQLPAGLSWKWLFEHHGEHQIVTTKLLVWFLYQWNGWNLVTHQAINFVIYGLLVFLLVWVSHKLLPQLGLWVFVGFAIFLLSPVGAINHSWGIGTSFHLSLVFFVLSLYLIFHHEQSFSHLLLGSFFLIVSAFSVGSGVIFTLALIPLFLVFKGNRIFSTRDRTFRRREIFQIFALLFLLVGAVAFWFQSYQKPTYLPPWIWPYQPEFWSFYLVLISWGFGFGSIKPFWGILVLLIVLVPLAGDFIRHKGRPPHPFFPVAFGVLGVLATLAATSVARADFGPAHAPAPRYFETAAMLIPLSALAWSVYFRDNPVWRRRALVAVWVIALLASRKHWDNFSDYRKLAVAKTEGVACITQYYQKGGEALCPTIYHQDLTLFLEQAKTLQVSFFRKIPPPQKSARTPELEGWARN